MKLVKRTASETAEKLKELGISLTEQKEEEIIWYLSLQTPLK